MPTKFGRHPFLHSSVILYTERNKERQNDLITSALLTEVTWHDGSTTTTILLPFFKDYSGELVPEKDLPILDIFNGHHCLVAGTLLLSPLTVWSLASLQQPHRWDQKNPTSHSNILCQISFLLNPPNLPGLGIGPQSGSESYDCDLRYHHGLHNTKIS